MLNYTMRKISIILFLLIGFTLSFIIIVSLFYNSNVFDTNDIQDDVLPQHYQVEFIDHQDYLLCSTKISFHLIHNRYQFSMNIPYDHKIEYSSIILYDKHNSISIDIEIQDSKILIKKHTWKKIFYQGNYTLSISSRINLLNEIKGNFVQQIWSSSNYRILFTKNHLFPYFIHSHCQSTFNININSSDSIISNLPLNQISSTFQMSHIAFSLLHNYECRSIDILQLCFPLINSSYEFDLFSHIFNYTQYVIQIFESYFSKKFPLKKLIFVTVLELNHLIISKSGLVFIDQNALLINTSAENIIQQRQLIFLIIAYQWIDTSIQFDNDIQWFGQSLARNIANYLFHKTNDPIENNYTHIEQFMSVVIRDALCNSTLAEESHDNIFERKGEAFLNEYRLYIGDDQFHLRIQQLIEYSSQHFINQSNLLVIFFPNASSFLSWSQLSGHPIIRINSSVIDINLFKFNKNCSLPILSTHPIVYSFLNDSSFLVKNDLEMLSNTSSVLIPFNPFIHIFDLTWQVHFIDDVKLYRHQQFYSFSKILFDCFLFNLANQLSIKYSLQLINLYFQQSLTSIKKSDLIVIYKIIKWYRSLLSNSNEEKFLNFLRKILNPFCSNQLWTRQILIDIKYNNQQITNDILLELCCSINHSICLQPISIRNDPQILIQFIFNHQQFDLFPGKSVSHENQTDMLTSFNQLQIPSVFMYPDRIVMNIICQIVRQQNEKYWYDLIHSLEQKFPNQPIPSSIINGLACAIRTTEQIDFYLNNLCPSSPWKWFCYRNIHLYSSIKHVEQLKTIDNEIWPTNTDEIIDFLFHTHTINGNFSSQPIIHEFQSLIFTWLTINQYEILHWLDNENN